MFLFSFCIGQNVLLDGTSTIHKKYRNYKAFGGNVPMKPKDIGRILRTFKIKKNVEVTDNGKIII